jgi:hypothetical protein
MKSTGRFFSSGSAMMPCVKNTAAAAYVVKCTIFHQWRPSAVRTRFSDVTATIVTR